MTEDNTKEKIVARLEAFLFIYGEPLSYKKIASTLKCEEGEVREAAKTLEEDLKNENRGLFLIYDKEKIQLATKPDFAKLLEDVIKEEMAENLTPAALETLSVIAYSGPVSRAEIDYVRGVNSSFILRNLSIRGLVDRETDPKRANAYVYKPSLNLFKFLGVSKAEDLPEHEKFSKLIEKLRTPELPEPKRE